MVKFSRNGSENLNTAMINAVGRPSAGEPVGHPPAGESAGVSFGIYVHVPYCASRCGYCDFNTYTAAELGGGASQAGYADDAIAEIRWAREQLGDDAEPAETVFFGGGTPTLLPPHDLGRILAAVRDEFGLVPGAEVTTEANPESVDARSLAQLREAGFTRISFGMQSARPHVLAVLDRRHRPGVPERRVAEARAAGFEHVNLDLIYGTPGESDDDWRASLDAVLAAQPDHVSAYALTVEEGTALARKVARGQVAGTDDDVLAARYEIADDVLTAAGFDWYEISNWSVPGGQCRHNLVYWRDEDWWGVGPGAHSHIADRRWWNVKHPATYSRLLREGASPCAGSENLDVETRYAESVMLRLRLRDGIALSDLSDRSRRSAERAVRDGLVDASALAAGTVVLTRAGRLLADTVTRSLLGWVASDSPDHNELFPTTSLAR